jgi:hypothetical protein
MKLKVKVCDSKTASIYVKPLAQNYFEVQLYSENTGGVFKIHAKFTRAGFAPNAIESVEKMLNIGSEKIPSIRNRNIPVRRRVIPILIHPICFFRLIAEIFPALARLGFIERMMGTVIYSPRRIRSKKSGLAT